MNVHHMRLFCAVVEARSFTRAAQQLHISQQAISLQIKRFEKELGFLLFSRTGRSIEMTPDGQEAYQHARAILEPLNNFTTWLDDVRVKQRPKVHVLCSSTPGSYIMPAILTIFHEHYPNVEVALRVVMTIDMAQALATVPSLDFALFIEEFSDARLQTNPVAKDELWVVAHPSHPLAARSGPLGLEELAAHNVVLRGPRCNVALRLLRAMADQGLTPQTMYVGSMEGCRTATQSKLGISYLSRFAVEEPVSNGLLKRLLVPDLHEERQLFLATRHGHHLAAPARFLMDLVLRRLSLTVAPVAR